jgi:putative spermidine/putrescine transport system substrate-binding protein
MHRRWSTGALVVVVLALVAAACGNSDGSATSAPRSTGATAATGEPTTAPAVAPGGSMPTSIGAGEGRLSLVVRAGYAGDGWVRAFQDETGCVVTAKVAATSDEMVQLMHTGQYDGVSATGSASTRLILAGDAAPVNVDLIRSYPDLSGFLKDQPYNTYQGTQYGIPQGWGANLLMWQPAVVQPDPDSWGAVFDANSPYKGKVTAYDDPMSIADAALYLKSAQPDLGITDVYELTSEQFEAAVALAEVQRTLIRRYWKDPAERFDAAGAGTAVIGSAWQVTANRINTEVAGVTLAKAIVPKEGATGWSDTWMVYAKAENPNCMYLWMDFITRPATQAQVATAIGEAPANPKACVEIAKSDPSFCSTFHVGDDAFAASLAFWTVPLPDCGDARGAVCEGYDAWRQAWREIRG